MKTRKECCYTCHYWDAEDIFDDTKLHHCNSKKVKTSFDMWYVDNAKEPSADVTVLVHDTDDCCGIYTTYNFYCSNYAPLVRERKEHIEGA